MLQRIKISEHFYLDEYVTPEMYKKWYNKAIWWIRPEIIAVDEFIRERFGVPMIINDWYLGGIRYQSGLRYPLTNVGAGDSLHKFGVASDNLFQDKKPAFYEEVRQDIIKNFELSQPLGLTTIEADTATWLHKDCRHVPHQTGVNIVPIPKKVKS